MATMKYINREIQGPLEHHIKRGKSILLLGPRQTGKSTLLEHIGADLFISLVLPSVRLRYEKDPSLLYGEIEALHEKLKKSPLIMLDEVQKVPALMDVAQALIDSKKAQFVLTGSSARKLKRKGTMNLLPGRVVQMKLDPFTYEESEHDDLETRLLYGSLPGIVSVKNRKDKEVDLQSYVETYLEEEVRAEALVRQMGSFTKFIEYAGLESGNMIKFRAPSQEIGVSHTTIASYFEILEDCLIIERIEPIIRSTTRKRLTKSNKYLIFDLGVRRLCAAEGTKLIPERWGQIFEQYVGLELVRNTRIKNSGKVRFWRDHDGPEIDWVVEKEHRYIPVEVKWTDSPAIQHAKHLITFMDEYDNCSKGYIVCRTNRPVKITNGITAIPWNEIDSIFD